MKKSKIKNTEVRLAMIGCGRRASSYPLSIKAVPNARLVALCDLAANRVGVIKKIADDDSIKEYTDYRKMLNDGGFDAVIVCTEPEYQARLSCAVMEAGKDVYSEVPVSYSLEDCWKLVVTAEQTRRVYYLGEQIRHTALMRHWQQIIRNGDLGSILFAEGHYIHAMVCDRYWRNTETGELLTWEQAGQTDKKIKSRLWSMPHPILYGPHELSPLLKILDDRVVRVSCFSTGSPNKRMTEVPFPCQGESFPHPDMEVALMFTAKGVIMRFAASFSTPVSEAHWYHLLGTKGEIETARGSDETGYSYHYPTPVLRAGACCFARTKESWFKLLGRPPEEIRRRLEGNLSAAARVTGHGGSDFYPLADFVSCLLNGTPPDIDVYQAVDTAAPCILAVQSAEESGASLPVPDFRPGKNRKKGKIPDKV